MALPIPGAAAFAISGQVAAQRLGKLAVVGVIGAERSALRIDRRLQEVHGVPHAIWKDGYATDSV